MNLEQTQHLFKLLVKEQHDREISDLEKAIVHGAWEKETYQQISDSFHLTYGYIRNTGHQLWVLLSNKLNQKVIKKTLRRILEQLDYSTVENILEENVYFEIQDDLKYGEELEPFHKQLIDWFKALDYEVEGSIKYKIHCIELIIRISRTEGWGTGFDRVFVRGVEGEAGLQDLEEIRDKIEENQTDRGLIIALRRISPTVKKELEKKRDKENIFCFIFDDFIDKTADFTSYIQWLEQEIEQRYIDNLYIPLASKKDDIEAGTLRRLGIAYFDESEGWTEGYLDRWLADPTKEHISILGEFGTGKTWLVLHYAWSLLKNYLISKDKGLERPRFPLVIQLRDYAKAVSVDGVLADFFFNKHKIRLTVEIFDQLNRMGKLLLIFDGFDEMADRVDRQKMINNFWELSRVITPGAKAILTCRTEHFPNAREAWGTLKSEFPPSMANYVTGDPPQFEILKLEPFTKEQIREVFKKRSTPHDTVEQILRNPQLRDLAQRPVMAEMVLEALPEIEAGKPIDLSRVYLYAVRRKMERDIAKERTFTSLADKLYFLCELAWEMLSTDKMSLNYRDFPDRIRKIFGPVVQQQKDLDHWHYDMMGNTILIRNDDGDYKPAHRSWLEFFVAYKLAAELGVLANDFTELAQQQQNINTEVAPISYQWSNYFHCEVVDGERRLIPGLANFSEESQTYLQKYWGKSPWAKAVLDLLVPMVSCDKNSIERLQKIILNTRGQEKSAVQFIGGNIATLLVRIHPLNLKKLDLSKSILLHADLAHAWLQDVNLESASLDGSEFIWSFGIPLSMAFNPNGEVLATGHVGGTIRFWRAKDGQAISVLNAHRINVYSIVFSPDGTQLASGSEDHTIKLWDIKTGNCKKTFEGHTHWVRTVSFSPDGTHLASGSYDKTVKLWDIKTGNCKKTFEGHTHWVRTVSFSPDGTHLASGGDDKLVKLWNIDTAKCKCTFHEHKHRVWAVVFSPDGTKLASCSSDETIKLWNLKSGNCQVSMEGHKHWVREVIFSPDGTQIVSGSYDHTIKVWEVNSGQCCQTLFGHKSGVWALAFSPDGTQLASGSSEQTIKLWLMNTYQCQYTLRGRQNKVLSIAFNPDGSQLACGSADQTIKIWDIKNNQCLNTLRGHHNWVMSIAFNPDGTQLVSSSDDRTIKVWDLHKGQCLQTFEGHQNWWVRSVAFSIDGTQIASGSQGKVIQLWDVKNGRCLKTLLGHQEGITSVIYSHDNSKLASGSLDHTIKIWDVESGDCLKTLEGHKEGVLSIACNNKNFKLASGSIDHTIKIWDIESGDCLETLEGHKEKVTSLVYSPCSMKIASGSFDHTIKIWDVESGDCLKTLKGHQEGITSLSFSPNGDYLASSCDDHNVIIWKVDSGEHFIKLDDRPYARLNISKVEGLQEAQKASLMELGAVTI